MRAPLLTAQMRRDRDRLAAAQAEIALLIDDNWPRPDRDSGSLDTVDLVRSPDRLGFEVVLAGVREHEAASPARPVDVPVKLLDIARIRRVLGCAPRMEWMAGLHGTAAWLCGVLPGRRPTAVRR